MSQPNDQWLSDHIDDDTHQEWIDALRSLVREEGKHHAKLLLDVLDNEARVLGILEKKLVLINWIILLSILAFSFSLLGTFIVRSGLLTSVHAFASDPSKPKPCRSMHFYTHTPPSAPCSFK